MKRTTRAVAAAGIALLGVGLLGGPAVAASGAGRGFGPGDGTCGGGGPNHPAGRGPHRADRPATAGQGQHRGATTRHADGTCTTCTAAPGGPLTAEQGTNLAFWVEEEKLAHDLYTAFAALYDLPRFERIAAAETRHRAAVRTLLARYDVVDPSVGAAPGAFADDELQARYDTLLAQGRTSLEAALGVGRTVENDDLRTLTAAAEGVTAADVLRVIEAQKAASARHLAAFGG